MARTLIVYHSRTGTSETLARQLQGLRGWALGEIRTARPAADWRCALEALLGRTPDIGYSGPDPMAYDVLVLVSPIWLGRLASPMRTFVARHIPPSSQVAVVSAMGGGGAARALAEVERRLRRRAIASLAVREADVRSGAFLKPLDDFAARVDRAPAAAPAAAGPAFARPAG